MTANGKGRPPRNWGRFRAFLAALSREVEAHPENEAKLLDAAAPLLADLVSHDDWLEAAYARPDPDRFQQYLLFCDPQRRFSVVSFVWGPGQRTPIHDHTTWGLVGLLRGVEISETFGMLKGELTVVDEIRMSPGDVIQLSPTVGDIHRVRNGSEDQASVSIHVYGGNIGEIERHVFEPDGSGVSFISGYSNRRLPNLWSLHAR